MLRIGLFDSGSVAFALLLDKSIAYLDCYSGTVFIKPDGPEAVILKLEIHYVLGIRYEKRDVKINFMFQTNKPDKDGGTS